MNTVGSIWVFSEKKETLAELCQGARSLGSKVSVLWIGTQQDAKEAIELGADHVYRLGGKDAGRMAEDYTATIADLIAKYQPGLLMFGTTKRCKLIAGCLAAKFRTSVLTDVMELSRQGEFIESKRMVYGGAAIRTEKGVSRVVIVSVGPGVFAADRPGPDRQGTIEEVVFVEPKPGIRLIERKEKQGEAVNLAAAKRVVAIGRGILNREDIKMVEELAGLIGAEIGCTRPIAEGANWLPRKRYIGVSGIMFKPELYIGIGVSGQIQHMVGCNQARTIAAINKDKAAPIFNQADYGLVGDLYKVVPLLLSKIKSGQ